MSDRSTNRPSAAYERASGRPIPNPQELYARLQAQGARRQAPSKGTPAGAPDLHPELEAQKRAQIEAAWRMREQQRAASPGVER